VLGHDGLAPLRFLLPAPYSFYTFVHNFLRSYQLHVLCHIHHTHQYLLKLDSDLVSICPTDIAYWFRPHMSVLVFLLESHAILEGNS
jgi:hypothetical protein